MTVIELKLILVLRSLTCKLWDAIVICRLSQALFWGLFAVHTVALARELVAKS